MLTLHNQEPESFSQSAQKVLNAAINLFSQKGFKGTSIRDIAKETGMTTSNLFHHFGSKEGVLLAIEKVTVIPLLKELRKIVTLDMAPVDRLALVLRTQLTYMGTHCKESRVFFLRMETSPLDRENFKGKAQDEFISIYRQEIGRTFSATGRKGDPSIAALSTFGVMNWFLNWYRPEGRWPMQAVIEYLTDYILHGIIGSRTVDGLAQDISKPKNKGKKKKSSGNEPFVHDGEVVIPEEV